MNSRIRFKSLSSGSAGNCYLIMVGDRGILIDAGVSMRRLKTELTKEHLSLDHIEAVLVTHDHMDHIRSLGSYCKHLKKPVWMTRKLRNSMATGWMTGEYLTGVVHILEDEDWTEIIPGLIKARYFVVPHDATQTVGYCLDLDGYNLVIMTDIGRMTDEAITLSRTASTVVIESNYDLDMLRSGGYPLDLQDRICGGHGHLSNAECADAIRDFIHPGLEHIFLCHLSDNNNTHEAALQASRPAIEGTTIQLVALPRQTPTQFFEL